MKLQWYFEKFRGAWLSFNPYKIALLKSIDGLNKDPNLKDIKYIAEDNYDNYKSNFYKTGTYS